MRVAVGSGNRVKRAATETVFDGVAGTTVEAVAVDPGVAEQPIGHAETIRGAETRASRALDAGAFDLGVGIEGGVADLRADSTSARTWTDGGTGGDDGELFLVMWAAVTDGRRVERGAGPSIRLPDGVAARVRGGEALAPVLEDAYDLADVAETRGAAGVLTGGLIDRERALADAVAAALGPFVTDRYD